MTDKPPTSHSDSDQMSPSRQLPPICGLRLKNVLTRKAVSENELAKRAHVSRNTIAKIRNRKRVRESSIRAICGELQIERSDIEVQALREEELPLRLSQPNHWQIVRWLSPWFTCDNGLQYKLVKLQNTALDIKYARGKLYDLLHVEPDRREAFREHLLRHAKVCELAKFDGERIARNLEVFPLPEGGGWWVIDDWIEGEALSCVGKDKLARWPLSRVAWLGSELLMGLKSLHSVDIIMRELAPERIYIENHRVSITDFELAKLIGSKISVKGKWLLDSPYRAPEVDSRNPQVASDIYSWGRVMLFVFSGDPETKAASVKLLAAYPEIQSLLTKCVSHVYKQRPKNVDEVLGIWQSLISRQ